MTPLTTSCFHFSHFQFSPVAFSFGFLAVHDSVNHSLLPSFLTGLLAVSDSVDPVGMLVYSILFTTRFIIDLLADTLVDHNLVAALISSYHARQSKDFALVANAISSRW